MAGTKNTAHVVQLKPVEVPKCMQDGEKFIKWDEVMSKSLEGTSVLDIFFFRWGICSVHIISGICPSPVRLEFVAAAVRSVMPYSLVDMYQGFIETCYLHYEGRWLMTEVEAASTSEILVDTF